tara:strand:- start:1387 stop:1614 length:228 start_codon:yes stop_codon:yes gene_type:complete
MSYFKTKSTKRFSFGINRDPIAKKVGSNIVTIATQGDASGRYSCPTMLLSMTVKEAQALQSFLNEHLSEDTLTDV